MAYQQFAPRSKPIISGVAGAALSIGTLVKAGATTGSFLPVSADTDTYLGVVMADVAAGDASATVCVRGGGLIVAGKLASPAAFGAALYLTGSTAGFTTASATNTTLTGSLTNQPVVAYSLNQGVGATNDLIDVVLV